MVKFKHPVIQWAHEHPVLFALFGSTLFFYAPARLIGKTIRIAKYGEATMGNIPGVMSEEERQSYTGTGNAGAIKHFGAIPTPEAGPLTGGALYREVHTEMQERANTGDIPKDQVQYHATAKYNQLVDSGKYNIVVKTAPGPDQGKDAGGFYRDSRHNQKLSWRSQIDANPYNPGKQIDNPVPRGKKYREASSSPPSRHANSSLLNLTGEGSVFAGLGLAHKLR